jgi:hypothetical protein
MFAIGNEASNFALKFAITQLKTEEPLLEELRAYLKCGFIYKSRNTLVYSVSALDPIINKIIPFFEKNKLNTSKSFNFIKFRKVALLKEKKKHLTEAGKKKILKIIVAKTY